MNKRLDITLSQGAEGLFIVWRVPSDEDGAKKVEHAYLVHSSWERIKLSFNGSVCDYIEVLDAKIQTIS